EIGDWLNHFDAEQSKSCDKMVSTRLSSSIPQFNYGVSLENQQRLYDLHTKQNQSQSS
ncbi:unnamed protein product, partial [Rotaria magnacalcarata]